MIQWICKKYLLYRNKKSGLRVMYRDQCGGIYERAKLHDWVLPVYVCNQFHSGPCDYDFSA